MFWLMNGNIFKRKPFSCWIIFSVLSSLKFQFHKTHWQNIFKFPCKLLVNSMETSFKGNFYVIARLVVQHIKTHYFLVNKLPPSIHISHSESFINLQMLLPSCLDAIDLWQLSNCLPIAISSSCPAAELTGSQTEEVGAGPVHWVFLHSHSSFLLV